MLRTALLRGRDHHELGAVGALAEGRASIALSRGGAKKTYPHTEDNEDAALFALGSRGMLVAVADGHEGASAAEAVLAYLRDRCAEPWTGAATEPDSESWTDVARRALVEANAVILRTAAERDEPPSRTTLSLVLVRPDEDLLMYTAIGDSHIFRAEAHGVEELGWAMLGRPRAYFLGYEEESVERQRDKCIVECGSLGAAEAVVLVTDGISERGIGVSDPAAAVHAALERARRESADLRPLTASREVAEAALAAQRQNRAGDNVASAVLWLGD